MICFFCLKEKWFAFLIAFLQNKIKDYFLASSALLPPPELCNLISLLGETIYYFLLT